MAGPSSATVITEPNVSFLASALGRSLVDPLLGALHGELERGRDARAAQHGAGVVEHGDESVRIILVRDDVEVDAPARAVGCRRSGGTVELGTPVLRVTRQDL